MSFSRTIPDQTFSDPYITKMVAALALPISYYHQNPSVRNAEENRFIPEIILQILKV